MPNTIAAASNDPRQAGREACSELAIARLIGRQLPCIITNRSALGMRLKFGAPPSLDNAFVLQHRESQDMTTVRLVWLTGSEAGVCIVAVAKRA